MYIIRLNSFCLPLLPARPWFLSLVWRRGRYLLVTLDFPLLHHLLPPWSQDRPSFYPFKSLPSFLWQLLWYGKALEVKSQRIVGSLTGPWEDLSISVSINLCSSQALGVPGALDVPGVRDGL